MKEIKVKKKRISVAKIKELTTIVEALNELISKVITLLGILAINISGLITIVLILIEALKK